MAEKKFGKFAKEKQFIKDKQIDELKIPPHSLEAEQSVLGGLLLDNETWDRVAEKAVAEDFYSRSHRLIFETIGALIELGEPVDLITLSEALENDQKLDDAGGFVYLAEMMKNTPSAANITAYADIVRERAVTREMISVANEIAEAGYDTQGRSSAELLDFAETKVFAIAEKRSNKSEGPESINTVLEKTVDRIEKLCSTDTGGVTGVPSGFTDLDKMTAGLQPSDLIIVAARPSMGKTTFAMNLAEHAAMTQDKPALIFSLEMPSDQIMMRMLASLGRIDQTKIRTGQLDDEDWARLSSTMGLLIENGKMFIDDAAGLTPTEVRSRARRIHRDHGGISLIMIDYLQLMRAPQFSDNRTLVIY
jgi:replicative DNA helicase